MSGPAQGNPRPFELSALVECITSVKQYIESDGKDRTSSKYISSGALDELVNTVLISSYSEVRANS